MLRCLLLRSQQFSFKILVRSKYLAINKVQIYLSVEPPGPLALPPAPRVVRGHVALGSPISPNTNTTIVFLPAGVAGCIRAFITPTLLHRL